MPTWQGPLPYPKSVVSSAHRHALRPLDIPLSAPKLLSLRSLSHPFWLDSGGSGPYAVSSFASAAPSEIVEYTRGKLRLFQDNAWREEEGDPLVALSSLWKRACDKHPPGERPRPLCVGYLTYDLGALTQRLSLPRRDESPSLYFASYDSVYSFDHASQRGFLVGAQAHASRLEAALRGAQALPALPALTASFDTTKEEYKERFLQVQRHLFDGDIYQANLSIGLYTPFTGEPLSLYERLRSVAKAPFGAYLEDGYGAVLSASMERFLRGYSLPEGMLLETCPIKGTRPRKKDFTEDQEERRALEKSEKDRAEHVMIVDLERNDLGRISLGGAVEVSDLFSIKAHPTVYHMESTIRGLAPSSLDLSEILRAMFPTGSITGAPKRRAMEIIASLEGVPRGVYCGAIGYLDDRGGFDFSVGIRTAELRGGLLRYRAGGGLVVDSDAELEWQECFWKAEGFLRALRG